MSARNVCKIEGCNKIVWVKGLCTRHYEQIRTEGIIFGNPIRGLRDLNEFIIRGPICIIKLYDKNGNEIAETIIDADDADKCRNIKWQLSDGYCIGGRSVFGKNKRLHRFVLGESIGKRIEVDHINRNKLDNRKKNLRWANKSQNAMNTELRTTNKSGYKGVALRKDTKKWRARLMHNYKEVYSGTFDNMIDAAKKYNEISMKFNGDFAYQNNIGSET